MLNKLSIIIPCFNEERYVVKVLEKVCSVTLNRNLQKEIIIVDDGSIDNTYLLIQSFIESYPKYCIKAIQHNTNRGKGACLKSALKIISGEILIIQDADLEYNPEDYNKMIEPIFTKDADIVLGSRFKHSGTHKSPFKLHALINSFFTLISNMFSGMNLTDVHTCYKMFKTDIIDSIKIQEERFGVDPELIAKLSKKKGIKITEVGISYEGRSLSEGKKISWRDGFRALYCIIKYNLF